jgi:hypothetical protein
VSAGGFDLHDARAALDRFITTASTHVADAFAEAVRRSPDGRLELILRTPVRYPVLGAIFSQMPRFFDRASGANLDATVRWRITGRADSGADVWDLTIRKGRCRVHRGESGADPRLTITAEAGEFVRLATGNSGPMQGYFGGRIKLAGDIMLAARLQTLFRVPGSHPGTART